ncbi:MAG TPA: transcriptional regulator [Gammaproteobacteria bacterium]|nr:transcriptional regulator [Gammaproteobacteria bacterium]
MTERYDYRAIDSTLHSRIRLAAMALLASVESADFRFLKEQTGATDGNLGAHLKTLRNCGYLREKKQFRGGKPNTTYRITAAGRQALTAYLGHLESLVVGRVESS